MNKIKEAIGLLCSMVDGREQHSATSRLLAIEALEENTRLLRIEEAAKELIIATNQLSIPMSSERHHIACERKYFAFDNLQLALKEADNDKG